MVVTHCIPLQLLPNAVKMSPTTSRRFRLGLRRLNRGASVCRQRFGRQGRHIRSNRQKGWRDEKGNWPLLHPRTEMRHTGAAMTWHRVWGCSDFNQPILRKLCIYSLGSLRSNRPPRRRPRETPASCSTKRRSQNRLRLLRGCFCR